MGEELREIVEGDDEGKRDRVQAKIAREILAD